MSRGMFKNLLLYASSRDINIENLSFLREKRINCDFIKKKYVLHNLLYFYF